MYTYRDRAPIHLFHLKFITVCTFVFSNEQAGHNS